MNAYARSCAVTTEHSLPVLEASHIRPHADKGPHDVANGLLLRTDFHPPMDVADRPDREFLEWHARETLRG